MGHHQNVIHKDDYTSYIGDLTVPWIIWDLLVWMNWLHCTDAENDTTNIFCSSSDSRFMYE